MRCAVKSIVEDQMKAKWNGQGISIDGIKDLVIEFVMSVIAHKLLLSIKIVPIAR